MLDDLVQVVRATGAIGVVGVYNPADPDAATEEAKEGRIAFDFGTAFTKGISTGTGQCPVKAYNRHLRDLIIHGRATPGDIVSHELPLDDAVRGFDQFDKRADGWTKVVLHPARCGAVRRRSDRTLNGLWPGSCARFASNRGRGRARVDVGRGVVRRWPVRVRSCGQGGACGPCSFGGGSRYARCAGYSISMNRCAAARAARSACPARVRQDIG
ncbi:hypothetical protein [Rathayibacter festucae]|uniref:hypothetical protein n=1 Tax=Rathayibacter festucae TaxID=110937 RepID=UPI002A6ADABF|nr:hypothetical protein [Rathayibacter festucae]MDY0912233.1 hypothetical protein [Rathayibacter festucae]